jgi:hypothetical protein
MAEREEGMAMAGIIPLEIPVQREVWSRTVASMSVIFSAVIPLLRKACLAMLMMWPTRLQNEGPASVSSS